MRGHMDRIMKNVTWNRTAEVLPTTEPGAQEDVIFCSPHWACPLVGMYTHWPEDSDLDRWSIYDQLNDRFVELGNPAPEFWVYRPDLPEKA